MSEPHEYWMIVAEEAMTNAGVSYTPEQHKLVAESIEGSVENMGQAFAPTPSASDMREWEESRVVKALREEIAQIESVSEKFREQVASDHKVDANRLYIGSMGRIEVSR